MKIQLVKTFDLKGIWYEVQVDGLYQSNTITQNLEKAESFYDLYVQAKGDFKTKEILKETEL